MMRKLKDYILYKNPKFYSAFPSVVLLPDNTILLMFRRARDMRNLLNKNDKESLLLKEIVDHIDSRSHLLQIILDQKLQLVSEPTILSMDPEAADQDASLLLQSNGNLLLSSFAWYPVHSRLYNSLIANNVGLYGHPEHTGCYYIMWGGFTRLSTDKGQSWSKHNYLPELPGAKDIIPGIRHSHGGPASGQPIELGDELLLPVYHYIETFKTEVCHLYVSLDGGENWQYRSVIAADRKKTIHFQEPSLVHCENNKIMALMRTKGANDHLYTSVSYDQGKNWEEPVLRKEIIGHPTHALKLKDGRIFICYGYRHKPYGVRGRLMDKNGEEFISDEIVIRDDGTCPDLGYPWAVQLSDETILVTYYFNQEDGIRYIAGTVLELS